METHKVFADLSKNRLYIIIGQVSSDDETRHLIHSVLCEAKRLKHGFTCVTDLRNFSLSANISDDFMQDCQEILWEGGIKGAARIISDYANDFLFEFEKKSKVWPAYRTENALSMEEAEERLDLMI